jgi:hypothetical protein
VSENKDQQLRTWAFGEDARSAAVELLIRVGLTRDDHPWVLHDRAWDTWAIDFDTALSVANGDAQYRNENALEDASDSEPRAPAWDLTPSMMSVLRIAASLAARGSVNLRPALSALEHSHAELVMIAIAHAAGFVRVTITDDPVPTVHPPLATWPE